MEMSSFQIPMKSLADDALFDAASSVITSSDFQSPRHESERKDDLSYVDVPFRKDTTNTLEGIVEQPSPYINKGIVEQPSPYINKSNISKLRHEKREKIKNDGSTGVMEQILDSFTILCNPEVDASRGLCRTKNQGLMHVNGTGSEVAVKRFTCSMTSKDAIHQSRDDIDCTSNDYLGLIDECQVPRSQLSNLSTDMLDLSDSDSRKNPILPN